MHGKRDVLGKVGIAFARVSLTPKPKRSDTRETICYRNMRESPYTCAGTSFPLIARVGTFNAGGVDSTHPKVEEIPGSLPVHIHTRARVSRQGDHVSLLKPHKHVCLYVHGVTPSFAGPCCGKSLCIAAAHFQKSAGEFNLFSAQDGITEKSVPSSHTGSTEPRVKIRSLLCAPSASTQQRRSPLLPREGKHDAARPRMLFPPLVRGVQKSPSWLPPGCTSTRQTGRSLVC